jgi:hypothetical protein
VKKAPTIGEQKSTHNWRIVTPSSKREEAPSYIFPAQGGGGCGRCVGASPRDVLADLLLSAGLEVWTSRVRLSCLLALTHHIAVATQKGDACVHGCPVAVETARQYSSKLRSAPDGVPREPLAALVRAGVLIVVAKAKVSWWRKESARYLIAPHFQKLALSGPDSETNTKTLEKLKDAPQRLEKGLNARFPFRGPLLQDLARVTIPETALGMVDGLLKDKKKRDVTRRVVLAVSTREHVVKVKPDGLIVTSLISCPRALKPHLHLAGEPVALCDISSAHWMFLPRLIQDRLDFCRKRGDEVSSMESMKAEMQRLVELCSSGSFYASMCRKGAGDDEIKARKKLFNVLLNSHRSRAESNVVWQGLKRRFPHCFGIIESIKKDNHRNISKALQHFTATAITAALLEIQRQGLLAFPDTDCLIVRARDKEVACRIIADKMLKETRGVLVTVGGLRFEKESGPCESKSET